MRDFAFPGVAVLLVLAATTASGQDMALDLYAQPQTLALLPDGRRINLDCLGPTSTAPTSAAKGTPTVILTSGLDNWSISWSKVQESVAQKSRVCTWDRAGFGFSDASPLPQDAEHALADLEVALVSAGIAGPYILVSQSAGSYENLLFADHRRSEVAGMVLVDPSIPDQPGRFASVAPAVLAFQTRGQDAAVAAFRKCAADLQAGLYDSAADPDHCFVYPATYPGAVKVALAARDSDPKRLLTKASREEEFADSAREVVNPRRNYGDLPMTVLTAETLGLAPDTPADVLAVAPALAAEWNRAHDALAALSTQGSNQVVAGSGHAIPVQKPEAVIAAIDAVIDQARTSAAH